MADLECRAEELILNWVGNPDCMGGLLPKLITDSNLAFRVYALNHSYAAYGQ